MSSMTLQPYQMENTSHVPHGPTMAHKAGAFTILMAASAAFVVMILWPLVARFV